MRRKRKSDMVFTGTDEYIFSIKINNNIVNCENLKLFNEKKAECGEIIIKNKNIVLKLNLPKVMGSITNLYPYQYTSSKSIELCVMQQIIVNQIKEKFGDNFGSEVNKVELSYLVAVNSHKEIEDVCNLFTNTFCDEKRQIAVYVNKKVNKKLGIEYPGETGIKTFEIKNKFKIKIYDKGNHLGLDNNYLRIEFQLLTRYLKQLFKDDTKRTIENIFTIEGLTLLQDEFCKCYEKYVVDEIKQYLNKSVKQLYERMVITGHPVQAYLEMKKYVPCLSVFKKALCLYADKKGMKKNARNQIVHYVKKTYDLNDTALESLRLFHDNC